jgi:hypothetical protein
MRSTLVLFVSLTVVSAALSQELACSVSVNADNVPSAQRDYLKNFKSDIEHYLNSTRFSSEEVENKITCAFDVFFKSSNSSNNQYTAQVYITSTRPIFEGNIKTDRVSQMIRILDESWDFTYTPNQRIILDDFIVDPFTDFLNYYAYIIIGFDAESFIPMSGSKYFQKALNICHREGNLLNGKAWQSSSSNYDRYGLADELNSPTYDSFHTAMNSYYFDGIDSLAVKPQAAFNALLESLKTLSTLRRENPMSVLLRQFFDAKYKEIAEVFSTFPNRVVYDQLARYDPEHRSNYQDWQNKP